MTDATLNNLTLSATAPDALILRVARQLAGTRRNVFVDVPGRAGSWVFPEQPGDRTVTIHVDITSASFDARRDTVRQLAYWADVGAAARLIIDDEPDRYHDAILDAAVDVNEWLTAATDIAVPFRVGPYALAILTSTQAITANTNPDSGDFAVTDTIEALPVIELTPAGGYVTELSLTVNGNTITWGMGALGPRPGAPVIVEADAPATSPDAGALVAFFTDGTSGYATYADGYIYDGFGFRQSRLALGSTLTISSISDTVTLGASGDVDLTGAFDPNTVDMSTVSGEFARLVEGSNTWAIEWTGTATSIGLAFTWRERFR